MVSREIRLLSAEAYLWQSIIIYAHLNVTRVANEFYPEKCVITVSDEYHHFPYSASTNNVNDSDSAGSCKWLNLWGEWQWLRHTCVPLPREGSTEALMNLIELVGSSRSCGACDVHWKVVSLVNEPQICLSGYQDRCLQLMLVPESSPGQFIVWHISLRGLCGAVTWKLPSFKRESYLLFFFLSKKDIVAVDTRNLANKTWLKLTFYRLFFCVTIKLKINEPF